MEKEFHEHGDLIWTSNEDGYFTVTEKTASFITLVDRVATALDLEYEFIFKTDDDTYAALDRLEARLRSIMRTNKEEALDYWGSCSPQQLKPMRDPSSIWSVGKDDYPGDYYPEYCQGAGYVLSRRFVSCAASKDNIGLVKYLKFEDVFVGILAERCQITSIYDDVGWLTRVRRSGRGQQETEREAILIQNGIRKIELRNLMWLPRSEMAGRILQHNILDDQDMKDYYKSYVMHQRNRVEEVPNIGDRLSYFYGEEESLAWLKATVRDVQSDGVDGENRIVTLKFDIDGASMKLPFDESYSGRWRHLTPLMKSPYYRKATGSDELLGLDSVPSAGSDRLNAAIVRLQNFSSNFYVYSDPEIAQPNSFISSSGSTDLDHLERDWKAEKSILDALKAHPLRTTDPRKSDFFIIPTSISGLLMDGCRWDDCSWYDNAFDALLQHPVYQETQGKGHVLISLNWLAFNPRYVEYFPALSRNYKKLRNISVAHHFDPHGARKLFLNYTGTMSNNSGKGFSLLYSMEQQAITETFCIGLGHDRPIRIFSPSYDRFESSEFFLFYHSRDTSEAPFGFGSTRYRDAAILNTTVLNNLPPSNIGNDIGKSMWKLGIVSSQFCLVVRGDTPHSHSLLYSIRAGCIPVVVSDDYETYGGIFRSVLSMSDFCIFVKEQDFLLDPLKELQGLMTLSRSLVEALLANIAMAQRILFADHPESLFVPAFLTELAAQQGSSLAKLPEHSTEVGNNSVNLGGYTVDYQYSKNIVGKARNGEGKGGPQIVVIVESLPGGAYKRRCLRNTWTKGYKTIFVVAGGHWDDFSEESAENGDIIWVGPSSDMNTLDLLKLRSLVGFSFVEQYLDGYDYVLRNDDEGFIFMPHAEQVLRQDPQDYWGVCEVEVVEKGEVVVSNYTFANASMLRPPKLGYFLSRKANQCLVEQLGKGISQSLPIFFESFDSWQDSLLVRSLLANCDIRCEDRGYLLDGPPEIKRPSFAAGGVTGNGKMLFHFWDAKKTRRMGEWAQEDQQPS